MYWYIKVSYFPPYSHSKNKIEVKLDLTNYPTKSDLANLKLDDDKSDIDKLEKLNVYELKLASTDLSKLSDIVKNDVVKKTEYDELVKNVNAVDTSKLVRKRD